MSFLRIFPKRLFASLGFSETLAVFLASILAGGFSYLLQFFVGRSLSLSSFGTFNMLLSLSWILGVLGGAFNYIVIKRVSELKAQGDPVKLRALFWQLFKLALIFGVGLSALSFLCLVYLSPVLSLGSFTLLLLFSLFMSLSFISVLPNAFLQGLLLFMPFAFLTVAGGVFRLSAPIALLSWDVEGLFLGLFISGVLSFVLGLWLLRKYVLFHTDTYPRLSFRELLPLQEIRIFVLFQVFLILLMTSDLMLVRAKFPADFSGIYAGIITMGKLLFFATSPLVSSLMYPRMVTALAQGRAFKRLVFTYLFLFVTVLLLGSVPLLFFPDVFSSLFLGTTLGVLVAPYVPLFSLYVVFYSLVNFFAFVFMGADYAKALLIYFIGVFIQVVLIYLWAQSLTQVILSDLIAVAFIFVFSLFTFIRLKLVK